VTRTRVTSPIVLSVRVRRTVDEAFELFTEGMGTWWPLEEHSVGAPEDLEIETAVIEPVVGGRVYEVWPGGEERDWGEVLVWAPPSRLVLAWHPGRPPKPATEVEVSFVADGDDTVVTLEHRGWERLGERGPESRADYRSGWPGVLAHFEKAAG
jgi:uncharacterized protein YndB with AHSA1/START domain